MRYMKWKVPYTSMGMPPSILGQITRSFPAAVDKMKSITLADGYTIRYQLKRVERVTIEEGEDVEECSPFIVVRKFDGWVFRGKELCGRCVFNEYDAAHILYRYDFYQLMDQISDTAGRFAMLVEPYVNHDEGHFTDYGTVVELHTIWLRKGYSHPTLLDDIVNEVIKTFDNQYALIFLECYPYDKDDADEDFNDTRDKLLARYRRMGMYRMRQPVGKSVYMWKWGPQLSRYSSRHFTRTKNKQWLPEMMPYFLGLPVNV